MVMPPTIHDINSFPNDKFGASNLKEFADDKQVESTVGIGEIARYEQFLLFSQCFRKTSTADT